MRQIKFRAINRYFGDSVMQYFDLENAGDYVQMEENSKPNNRWVVMQYTGVKDILGEEIYEGDIAKQFFTEGEELMECKWGKTGYVWSGVDDGVSGDWSGENFEVVGDIYSNPELLSTKE